MDEKDLIIAKLLEKIAQLEKRIAELEKQLGKNSQNSSYPPSRDGFRTPPRTQSLREKGQRSSGGQAGHVGETLKQSLHPDKVERHALSDCPHCNTPLSDIKISALIKRQVFDLPVIAMEVTEHQGEVKACPCCQKRVRAPFPEGVNAPVQYGKRMQSVAVYLQHQQFIPEDRLQEMFYDLFQVKIATASLTRFSQQAYSALSDMTEQILSGVSNAPVKHLDETGFKIAAKQQWLHVASTDKLTYYHASARRKALLDNLKGIVVHDHWKSYYLLPDVLHGLCNQHHLRELKALIDYDKEAWAKNMQRCLRVALRYRHRYANAPIPDEILTRLIKLYDTIVQKGLLFHEQQECLERKGKRIPRRTGHNLVLRLQRYKEDVLRFLTHPHVPFTNNQAESDIRMMKCKQKISGGFRTREGAEIFARIRGFISTARKQGWNIFDSLQSLFYGKLPTLA